MTERGLTKQQILTELTKSPHGKLEEYLPVATAAVAQEPEFLAHLIAWNREKGQIRDSKAAVPAITLANAAYPTDFVENSLAHLGLLVPRELLKAQTFYLGLRGARGTAYRRLKERYLRTLEANWGRWTRVAMQHRSALRALYAPPCRVKPATMANEILFRGARPRGSVFESIAQLKNMAAGEAAGTILERKIPFLIALGALGAKAKEADIVMALIDRMSPTELVTNSKMLQKLGVKTVPALRAAYEAALAKASASKSNTLKTTQAAEAIEDEGLKVKLQAVQEKQIEKLGGIEGNWLVAGDASGSMAQAIEAAKYVAASLARFVKGQVHLVFFNTSPMYLDVTDLTLDQIVKGTAHYRAGGGTSIGCSLQAVLDRKLEIDGIAVISDGGENNPPRFVDVYQRYAKTFDREPPVYLYLTTGDLNVFSSSLRGAGIDVQEFDIRGGVDFYSLPNLVQTMRASRYSLIDEIMVTPLVALNDVFEPMKEKSHA